MDNIDTTKIWQDTLNSIKVSVSSATFSTWFTGTFISSIKENGQRVLVEIGCNSSYAKNTIETRYYGIVQDTLTKALSIPCDLVFSVKQPPATASQPDTSPLFQSDQSDTVVRESLARAGIRPSLSFDNYAVSSSNQMAWAAAEAVSKSPGSAYNPLFIWGGVGVGKTHLMNAIGHFVLEKDPAVKTLSCTGEQFTNDIVEGIRSKTTPSFRSKYRKLNLLFVDDIQFIAGKDAVQQEFFHTFNALVGMGAQIVLTSDKPPSEISKLEERLRSRFEAGLIVDISPPDFELRCAIVQIKSQEKGFEPPMDIVHLIAGNIQSPRQIEGFLVKLISEVRLHKIEVTAELVESKLKKGTEENGKLHKRTPEEIIDIACKYFSLSKKSMMGAVRARKFARPRQILMYTLRTQLGLPFDEVGRLIGGRDHSTAMHAVEKITTLASTDVNIREHISGIKTLL